MKSKHKLSLIILLIFINLLSALASEGNEYENSLKDYNKLDIKNFKFNELTQQKSKVTSKRDTDFINKYLLNTNELKFHAFNRDFHIYLKKDLNVLSNDVNIEVKYANNTNKRLNDVFTSNFYIGFVNDPVLRSSVLLYYDFDNLISNKTVIYAKIELGNETYYIEPANLTEQEFIIYRRFDVSTDLFSNGIFNKAFCKTKSISETNLNVKDEQAPKWDKKQKRSLSIKNRCKIALVADYRYYKEIGNNNEQLTTLSMINVMNSVNKIFKETRFSDEITNVAFDIEKITVYAEPHKETGHYNSDGDYKSADDVLDLFGVDNWSSFCLAHLFTYQNFEGNVLGLAYVSSPRINSYGGMCSSLMPRKGTQFSSNIGLSSYKSPSGSQRRLLQTEAELVTTHELGHNWGSEHDPDNPRCTPPSSQGGNYIMYAYANQGYDKNNFHFSPCSIISIAEVVKAKALVCFKEESKAFCGNSRIEEGEECDGGIKTRHGYDPCCNSKCLLHSYAKCSDLNHDCCKNCTFAPLKHVCFASQTLSECYEQVAYCAGNSKICPPQNARPANTQCSTFEEGRCNDNGLCLSLCKQKSVTSDPCFCKESRNRCMQCCTNPANDSQCLPFHELYPGERVVHLSDGRSCLEGRCEHRICVVKVKDQINRFWTIIEKITANSAIEFMRRNIVGTVIIISLIIWVPFSCFIHFCIDKRQRALQKEEAKRIMSNAKRRSKHLSDLVEESQRNELLKKSDTVD